MGKYVNQSGIECFEPDNGPEHFYLECSASIIEIAQRANDKWPDGYLDLEITPEYIHTWALGYDRYDPSDYTNYLRIERIKE